MFDRIIDFLLQIWNELLPFCIVNQYQMGVRLRFGKFRNVVQPGFNWKLPLADLIIVEPVVETTLTLPTQSLTTADDKQVVVKGMIKYRIDRVDNYVLNVYDAKDALQDISCGVIKSIITEKTWEYIRTNDLDNDIAKKVRSRLRNYGIDIIQTTLVDLSNTKSLRLFNEQVSHNNIF